MGAESDYLLISSAEDARKRFVNSPIFFSAGLIVLLVSSFIGFSLYWNLANLSQQQLQQARAEAESHWNKDLSFRRWATRHGGVYVKPDIRTPPNPYLAHLPNRDIVTADGDKLTAARSSTATIRIGIASVGRHKSD